jgi:hypothetical protein
LIATRFHWLLVGAVSPAFTTMPTAPVVWLVVVVYWLQ